MRILTLLCVAYCLPLQAERLSITAFDVKDGLAHGRINCIVATGDGYMWFCTDGGLSRFDGHRFVSYRERDGLPHAHVNAMIVRRNGEIWLATDGGVARFDGHRNAEGRLFTVYRLPDRDQANNVNDIAEDHSGNLWCATSGGLFRMQPDSATFQAIEVPFRGSGSEARHITRVLVDRGGSVWVGTVVAGVWRNDGAGAWRRFSVEEGLPDWFADVLKEDAGGGVWVGTRIRGAVRLRALSQPPWFQLEAKIEAPLTAPGVFDILPENDGRLAVSGLGLAFWRSGPNGFEREKQYGTAHGITEPRVRRIGKDRAQNLWLGLYDSGLVRITPERDTNWEIDDVSMGFQAIHETAAGETCLWSAPTDRGGYGWLQCLDGDRMVRIVTPPRLRNLFFQSHDRWWFDTGKELVRLDAVRAAGLSSTKAEWILPVVRPPGPEVFGFVDAGGNVWVGGHRHLTRWDRGTNKTQRWVPEDFALEDLGWSRFIEPAPGVVWIGHRHQSLDPLLRWRNARMEVLPRSGSPKGRIEDLHTDRTGRLWIATGDDGLYRVDRPSDSEPKFIRFSKADGLSSNELRTLTEDTYGRIYVGTTHGIDRLTGDPPRIQRLIPSHSWPRGSLEDTRRDRKGNIWIATSGGLSRFIPQPQAGSEVPQIILTGLQAGDVRVPLSELGQRRVGPLQFDTDQNQVRIECSVVEQRVGARFRYQMRLGNEPNWGDWTEDRLNWYARLAPGEYRFEVRVEDEFGQRSTLPATVEFEIAAPLWQRWWFLLLAAMLLAGAGFAFHRTRLNQELALAEMRGRISADLHDDVGSSLTRIVLLSELAQRRLEAAPDVSTQLLHDIGETGRGLLDNMTDIVWSIDPRRDRLQDLAIRIREYAGERLDAEGIEWSLDVDKGNLDDWLSPEHRRQIYLIFKEAIHNAAKHSGGREIRMSLHVANGQLLGSIRDRGKGLAYQEESGGNGLRNMQRRAAICKGRLEVISDPANGTEIRVSVPAARQTA